MYIKIYKCLYSATRFPRELWGVITLSKDRQCCQNICNFKKYYTLFWNILRIILELATHILLNHVFPKLWFKKTLGIWEGYLYVSHTLCILYYGEIKLYFYKIHTLFLNLLVATLMIKMWGVPGRLSHLWLTWYAIVLFILHESPCKECVSSEKTMSDV